MSLISFLFGECLFPHSLGGWIRTLSWNLRGTALKVLMCFWFSLSVLSDIGVVSGSFVAIDVMTGVEPIWDVFFLDSFLNVLYTVSGFIGDSFGRDFYLNFIFYLLVSSLLEHKIEILWVFFVIIQVIVWFLLNWQLSLSIRLSDYINWSLFFIDLIENILKIFVILALSFWMLLRFLLCDDAEIVC